MTTIAHNPAPRNASGLEGKPPPEGLSPQTIALLNSQDPTREIQKLKAGEQMKFVTEVDLVRRVGSFSSVEEAKLTSTTLSRHTPRFSLGGMSSISLSLGTCAAQSTDSQSLLSFHRGSGDILILLLHLGDSHLSGGES